MATYLIGVGGAYPTITDAEAALTLPEAGGTVYEITGTVIDAPILTSAKYLNGVTLTSKLGEAATGTGTGARIDGLIRFQSGAVNWLVNKLNIRSVRLENDISTTLFDDCDIGELSTLDVVNISTVNALATFTNCIIRTGTDDGVYASGQVPGVSFVRCSVVDAARFGALRTNFNDSFIFGSVNLDFHSTVLGDFNASEDNSASIFTNNLQGEPSTHFNDYANGDLNLAPNSTLRTAGSGGGVLGAILKEPTQITSPPTVFRGETAIEITSSNLFGAVAGTVGFGNTTLGFSSVSVVSWNASSIFVDVPLSLTKLYATSGLFFRVTHQDTTIFDGSDAVFTPPIGRSYLTLVNPVFVDDGYMLFGFTDIPDPVSTDQLEFDTNTPESNIANLPTVDSGWVLDVLPIVTQTTDCHILRAATEVRSSSWKITWQIGTVSNNNFIDFNFNLSLEL